MSGPKTSAPKGRCKSTIKVAADAAITPPPVLPEAEREMAESQEICRRLDELTRIARQNNLNRAVILAQMAARGRGPLVDHFAELGRRYAHLVEARSKPCLRVIEGDQTDGKQSDLTA
jgi:hypothetical protein